MGHCMISKKQNNDFLDLFDFFIPGDVAQYKVESVTGYVRRGSSNPGNRTSARENFTTRTPAQISKNFINFGTN